MDTIKIKDIELETRLGVPKEERTKPQRVLVSVKLSADTKEAAAAQENVTKAQFESKLTENRLGLASNLARIRQKIGSDAGSEEIRRELDRVLDGLIDPGSIDARIK